jgi:hypothetical protein
MESANIHASCYTTWRAVAEAAISVHCTREALP